MALLTIIIIISSSSGMLIQKTTPCAIVNQIHEKATEMDAFLISILMLR